MTITGGSALPKDDIERMMREAEKYAEEDRQRREEAEVRNRAETLVYPTEKFLAENADKVPDDIKTEVESAIADAEEGARGHRHRGDQGRPPRRPRQVSQKMGTAIYAAVAGGQRSQRGWRGSRAAGRRRDGRVRRRRRRGRDRRRREAGEGGAA